MLIGFDASRAFLKENTGTENYSFNLLRALAKIDAKNSYLIYLRDSENLKVKKNFPKNFQFKVIKPFRLWTQVGLAIETWRKPVDVLFIPAHTLPILRKRFSLSRRGLARLKTLVTIHDLGVEYLPGYHKFPDKYYLDFASKYAANNADLIIAVSEETKHDLTKRYKIDQSNIFVINEGVDKTLFKQSSIGQIKSAKLKYKIDGNYFLFVSTIQPRKNLLMLIDAFALFVKIYTKKKNVSKYVNQDYSQKINSGAEKSVNSELINNRVADRKFSIPKLVICGKKGWDYETIINRPIEHGISDLVLFLDYVPKEDLPALYSGAVAFLYPSLFEGFGLPILESLACDCPVIASDIGPHREIFSEINKGKNLKENKRTRLLQARNKQSFSTNKSAYFSMTSNNSRKKNSGLLLLKSTKVKHFVGNLDHPDSFEAMSLVNPLDEGQWSRFLYQYITMYNNRNYSKRPGILLKKSYNWEEVAQKTLSVFEKVINKK